MATGLGNYPSLIGVSNSVTNNTVNTNITNQGQASYETDVNFVPIVLSVTNTLITLPNKNVNPAITAPGLAISTVLPNLTVGGLYRVSFDFFYTCTSAYAAGDFALIGVFSPISGSGFFSAIGFPNKFVPIPVTPANTVVPGSAGQGTYSTIFTAQALSGVTYQNYIVGGYWYSATQNASTTISCTFEASSLTIQKIG